MNGGTISGSNISFDADNSTGFNFKFGAKLSGAIFNGLSFLKKSANKRFDGLTKKVIFGDMLGIVRKDKGTAVINAGSNKIVVKHYVGKFQLTNEDVIVTPRTPITPAINFWISDVKLNEFTINVDKPVTQNAVLVGKQKTKIKTDGVLICIRIRYH